MDLAQPFCLVGPAPVSGDERAVVWRGALLPVVLPTAGLPPAARAACARQLPAMPVDQRVDWLLSGGDEPGAWQVVAGLERPPSAYGRLDAVLAAWSARESARQGWPAPAAGLVLVGPDPGGRAVSQLRGALADVGELYAALPSQRWSGALVLALGADDPPGLAGGRDLLVRPALPVLRVRELPSGDDELRGLLAARLAALVLALNAPPANGWPPWLRLGVAEVALAKGRGQGPSPRAMHQLRSEAGVVAIAALLAEDTVGAVDRRLAGAVAAWLLNARRSPQFPALLARLRAGDRSPAALLAAYQCDPERLVRER